MIGCHLRWACVSGSRAPRWGRLHALVQAGAARPSNSVLSRPITHSKASRPCRENSTEEPPGGAHTCPVTCRPPQFGVPARFCSKASARGHLLRVLGVPTEHQLNSSVHRLFVVKQYYTIKVDLLHIFQIQMRGLISHGSATQLP